MRAKANPMEYVQYNKLDSHCINKDKVELSQGAPAANFL